MVEAKQTIRKMFKFERGITFSVLRNILKSEKFHLQTLFLNKKEKKKKQPSVTLFNELLILNVLDIFAKSELPSNNKNIDQLT